MGYCRTGSRVNVASICIHKGEEPVISGTMGICNVFFSHCNLQCLYCQNHQISSNETNLAGKETSPELAADEIIRHLKSGCTHVGFVSPSHQLPQMVQIINEIRNRGHNPVFVYNTSAYDKPEVLKNLDRYVDVYLPDLKYVSDELAENFSGAPDYPAIARASVKEMYRQKGSTLLLDDNGNATSGLIIRHLVLPGQVMNSKAVLRFIVEELSPLVHISLMSQYYPTQPVAGHLMLNRQVTMDEYQEVVEEMENLGIYRGWVQEMESRDNYRPDFEQEDPFEGTVKI